jgi:L-ascorbate metabolism protein UlaG (beta-lactamase superfamily)
MDESVTGCHTGAMKIKKLLGALLTSCLAGCASYHQGPPSDHFNGKRFFNPWPEDKKNFLTFLKWQMTSDKKKWPEKVPVQTLEKVTAASDPKDIQVTFVNHATVYIQHAGLRFITDPHWSERASPLSFAGPKRVKEPGVKIEGLPGLDYVLVSHNHYDHLDVPTLKRLKEIYDPVFLVPLGNAVLLKEAGIIKFRELDWWQSLDLGEGREVVLVPARHWSARGLFDRNKALWGGFVILTPYEKIYFAGDTGYCDLFKTLAEKYGSFSFSLLPMGAYEPRWFMKDAHMNPMEAAQAHLDLKSQRTLGVHWGLFPLTDEGIDDPVRDLAEARNQLKIPEDQFFVLEAGQESLLKFKKNEL